MGKKILLIINPMAGKGQAKSSMYNIVSPLCTGENAVTIMMTAKHGDAERFAREYSTGYDIVSCVGGDGTLSEVVCGLMQTKDPPPIGYIPLGSTNDVATTLKISKLPIQAAEDILTGTPMPIDIGKFGNTFFTYVAAFGAFTEVAYSTPQESKNALGPLAYFIEGVASLPKITSHHVKVTYDDGYLEGDFIYGGISNSTSVAGVVKLTKKNVGLNDGLFEVLLIKHPGSLSAFNQIIPEIVTQNYSHDSIVFLRTKNVKFEFEEEVAWTRDGENGGKHRIIEASNMSGALKIIIQEH